MNATATTVLKRIRTTALAGAALCCLALPADAAPSDPTRHISPGLVSVIAQNNAREGSQEALQKLQRYFGNLGGDAQTILDKAADLIAGLPEGEVEAAWRIGTAAQLAINAGRLSETFLGDEFSLPAGAVAWDFGPEKVDPYPGFIPVNPNHDGLVLADDRAVPSPLALQDGIGAVEAFQAPLPNGIYRVVLLSDSVEETKRRDGVGAVTINGDRLDARGDAEAGDDLLLEQADIERTEDAKSEASRFRGTGVEGVAFVADGHLVTEFSDLPQDRFITAVIAVPVDYDTYDLAGPVFDLVTDYMSGLATAAGPGLEGSGSASGGTSGTGGGSAGGNQGGGQTSNADTNSNTGTRTPAATGGRRGGGFGGGGGGGFGTGFSSLGGIAPVLITSTGPDSDFINDTPFSPGSSPGITTVEDDFIQTEDGVIEFEIGGLTPGVDFDQLQVGDDAIFRSGGISVSFVDFDDPDGDPFLPAIGDDFDLVIADDILFADTDRLADLFNMPAFGLPETMTFDPIIVTEDGRKILRISMRGGSQTTAANVPAPAGLGLFGLASLALFGFARRRA